MAKLNELKTVLDFLKGLQPKVAAQIAKKVLALNIEPRPSDSNEVIGYPVYYRETPVSIESSANLPRRTNWLR